MVATYGGVAGPGTAKVAAYGGVLADALLPVGAFIVAA